MPKRKRKMVLVDTKALSDLLTRVDQSAKACHAVYDRRTKTWPWNDALYKRADPYEFGLYQKLRDALRK